jgi:hypothetical protein
MTNYTKFLKIAVGTGVAALALEGAAVGIYNLVNDWNYTRLTGQSISKLVHDCDNNEVQMQNELENYTALYQNPPARLSFTTEDNQGKMQIHLIPVKKGFIAKDEDLPSPEEVKKRLNNIKETVFGNLESNASRFKMN